MANYPLIKDNQALTLLIFLNFYQLKHPAIKELMRLRLLTLLAIMKARIQLLSRHKYLILARQKNSKKI